jgi:hypothetical protein
VDLRAGVDDAKRKLFTLPGLELRPLSRLARIFLFYFFLFEYWGVESILGPLGTAATPGQLHLPRVIVRIEKLV